MAAREPKPLVVVVGPTASGKSSLAMDLARRYNGELICADSRTVYKGMDIGTAKPTTEDRKIVPHHLLDVVNPNEHFTAVDFKRLANKAIIDILTRGKLPIMVGGSGLYVDAVIFDYQFGEPADPSKRKELQRLTIEELQEQCIDNNISLPENAQNKRHLIRAIELGGLVSAPRKLRSDTIVVGISTDREVLRERIKMRAQQMVNEGVVREVAGLGSKYGWESEAMSGNIYRIFRPVVTGQVELDVALQQFVQSDMQLAKKQMTWFRRNPYIIWGSAEQLKQAVNHFVQQNKSKEPIISL